MHSGWFSTILPIFPLAQYPWPNMVAHFHPSCLSIYNLIFPFTIIQSSICNYTFFPSALHHYHSWQQIPLALPATILPSTQSYHLHISTKQHHAIAMHNGRFAGASNGHLQTTRRQSLPHPGSKECYSLGSEKLIITLIQPYTPYNIMSSWHCTLSTSKSTWQSKKHKYYKCVRQHQHDKKQGWNKNIKTEEEVL